MVHTGVLLLHVTGDHSTVLPVIGDQITVLPVTGDHITVLPVTGDHITVLPVTGDHITVLPVTGDHITVLPITGDHITVLPLNHGHVTVIPVIGDMSLFYLSIAYITWGCHRGITHYMIVSVLPTSLKNITWSLFNLPQENMALSSLSSGTT